MLYSAQINRADRESLAFTQALRRKSRLVLETWIWRFSLTAWRNNNPFFKFGTSASQSWLNACFKKNGTKLIKKKIYDIEIYKDPENIWQWD